MKHRVLIELDKSGAEWVVVAYCSGDARMIDICERGVSPHPITGNLITGAPVELIMKENKLLEHLTDPIEIERLRRAELPELFDTGKVFFLPRTMSIRQCGKKSNHGLNYIEGPNRFALENEIDASEAKKVIHYYTRIAYPNIPIWWEAVKRQLRENRTLENCFGRRRRFLDQWGHELFKQGVAFIPQSTVADMVIDGMTKSYNDSELSKTWDLEANVYDSLLFQVEFEDWKRLAAQCVKVGLEYMNAECSYSGRSFRIGTEMKIGPSWGRMAEVKLHRDIDKLARELRTLWGELNRGKAVAA